jgi:hypothetical protein
MIPPIESQNTVESNSAQRASTLIWNFIKTRLVPCLHIYTAITTLSYYSVLPTIVTSFTTYHYDSTIVVQIIVDDNNVWIVRV